MALGLARQGASVVVAARSETEQPGAPGTIHATAAEIQAQGGKALAVRCNVREEESIYAMVQKTMDAFESIDVLVNNAAVGSYRSFLETTVKQWDLVVNIDLRAPFVTCKAVVPIMVQQGAGSIINVSSYAANTLFSSTRGPGPGAGTALLGQDYGAAKAGLERFSWGLAAELGRHNIAVNVLKPLRPVITEGLQAQRPEADFSTWATPDALVQAAIFLAQQDARGLTGAIVTDEEIVQRLGL